MEKGLTVEQAKAHSLLILGYTILIALIGITMIGTQLMQRFFWLPYAAVGIITMFSGLMYIKVKRGIKLRETKIKMQTTQEHIASKQR